MHLRFHFILFLALLLIGFFQPFLAQTPEREEDKITMEDAFLLFKTEDLVVITASRLEESRFEAPSTVYTVTQENIISNGYYDLIDILENVPGMNIMNPSFFAWGGQRGFVGSFSQTILLVDGREMQNLIAGETFISHQFATHNIKRVEIVQGPASALYGANAFAGVIHIITKNSDKKFNRVEAHAEIGSQGTQGYSVVFGKTVGDIRVSGSYRVYKSDGWDFTNFVNNGSDFYEGKNDIESQSLDARNKFLNKSKAIPFALRLDYSLVKAHTLYSGIESYDLTTTDGLQNISLNYDDQEDHRELSIVYVGWDYEINKDHNVNVEYSHYNEKGWGIYYSYNQSAFDAAVTAGDISATDTTISEGIAGKYFTGVFSQEGSSGNKKDKVNIVSNNLLLEDLSVILGYTYERLDGLGFAESKPDDSKSIELLPFFDETRSASNPLRLPQFLTTKNSLFLQAKKPFFNELVYFTLGGRLDYHSTYKEIITLRSGLVFHPAEKTYIKALFGQAFREPTIYELGAPGLQPATLNTGEVGITQGIVEAINIGITGFYTEATNFIKSTGSKTTDFENSSEKKKVIGVESQLYYKFVPEIGNFGPISGEINHTFLRPDSETYGTKSINNLNVHAHRISTGINIDFFKYFRFNSRINFYSKVTAKHGNTSFDSDGDGSGFETIEIPGFTKVNFTLSVPKYVYKQMHLTFAFTVKNAFNQTFYHPNVRTTGSKWLQQAGRQFIGRLIVSF